MYWLEKNLWYRRKIIGSLFYSIIYFTPGLVFADDVTPEPTFVPKNGEIEVRGLILAEPCTPVNDDIIVDFGVLTNKDLFRYDRLEKFSIDLDCEPGTDEMVKIQFSSSNVSENDVLLNFDLSSQATGVGIKIEDELTGQLLKFNQPESSFQLQAGINSLNFIAHASRKQDTTVLSDITFGVFTATASFIIEYN